MGVSFKISRTGTRYRPRLPPPDDPGDSAAGEKAEAAGPSEPNSVDREVASLGFGNSFADCSVFAPTEHEASFSLNLFPDGFSIGKPTQGMLFPLLQDAPKFLHPYNRASMSLLSAIEYGWLPGDILGDIPCKYYNGTLICEVPVYTYLLVSVLKFSLLHMANESPLSAGGLDPLIIKPEMKRDITKVWDYRPCMSEVGNKHSSVLEFPKVQKICLRMGMENVVKDMSSISDESWSYSDLLQAESQIIKALTPMLNLAPDPSLDRLCKTPASKQLDLGLHKQRLARLQHSVPEINLKPTDLGISSNGLVENLKSQTTVTFGNEARCNSAILGSMPSSQQYSRGMNVKAHALPFGLQSNYNSTVGLPPLPVLRNAVVASNFLLESDQNIRESSISLKNSSTHHGKRKMSEAPATDITTLKKPKQDPPGFECSHFATGQWNILPDLEFQRRITPSWMQQDAQNMQHLRLGTPNLLQQETREASNERTQMLEVRMTSCLSQHGIKHMTKEEPIDTKILSLQEVHMNKSFRPQQPISIPRSLPPQLQWSNAGPSIEKNPMKENALQKMRPSQGPQVSARSTDWSQVSLLGNNQRMSAGASRNSSLTVGAIGLDKGKAALAPAVSRGIISVHGASANTWVPENQLPPQTKRKSRNRKVTLHGMGKTISTASNGDTRAPSGSNNFSVRNILSLRPLGTNVDPVLERFLRIKMVVHRHGLNKRNNEVDNYLKRTSLWQCPSPPVKFLELDDAEECRSLTERICMSKYLIQGSRNACKTRILTFVRVRFFFRGKGIPFLIDESRSKLVLSESEEPADHRVGADLVFGDDEHCINVALLPTPHCADLFAAQFISLMEHEGYKLVDDQLQPSSSSIHGESSSNSASIDSSGVTQLPCVAPNSGQLLKPATPFGSNGITNVNQHQTSTRMPTSCANLTRPQQLEIVSNLSSMQKVQPQNQSSLPLIQHNLSDSANTATINAITNSPAHLQLLQLQRNLQPRSQQQTTLQSKMANLGTPSPINSVGGHVSGLNIPQNIDRLRQIPGFSRLDEHFFPGGISEAQEAALAKLRHAQNMGIRLTDNNITTMNSTHGIVQLTGDKPLLDQAVERSCIEQLQYRGKGPVELPNYSSKSFLTGSYTQQLQQHILQQGKLQHPLKQEQQWFGSYQQTDSLIIAQLSQPTKVRPEKLNTESTSHQVNDGIGYAGAPQLSS